MTALPQLVEQSTRHQVHLERLKTGEANQFAAFLKQIDSSIRGRLTGKDLTEFSRGRLERLLASVEKDLESIYSAHWLELKGNLIELGQYEAGFESRSLNEAGKGRFETVVPTNKQVRAAVIAAPLSVRGADGGKLLEPFIRDWSQNETKRVVGAIRQGYFEGQTTSKILQAVRGTRANGFRDGILAVSNRTASAIVRTAVQHVASTARQETWNENSDIVQKVRWVSTLDTRTSPQCQSLDGREFPIGSGPRPPIHINCRSTTVPVLDSRYDFLSEGATRSARDDDGVGRVGAGQTYYSWLKRQPAGFQDTAIGPVRGKLLRNGGLTAERFSELSLGKNFEPLSLDQMRRLEPVAFEKAGI
jgi:SPP1 gp7 family putative phage head morphogenesis protein